MRRSEHDATSLLGANKSIVHAGAPRQDHHIPKRAPAHHHPLKKGSTAYRACAGLAREGRRPAHSSAEPKDISYTCLNMFEDKVPLTKRRECFENFHMTH